MSTSTSPPFPPPSTVHWDETHDEPYLSPASHPSIRLCPYRDTEADLAALERISNDPRVAQWSFSRPFPFTRADARARFDEMVPAQRGSLDILRRQNQGAVRVQVNPFSVIRADGAFVGDMALFPSDPGDDTPVTVEQRRSRMPSARRAGEGAMWAVAYALDPAFWGRGIGTAAVRTLLEWARAEMGVRRVEATVETGNPASTRLMEKLGFVRVKVWMQPWPAHNGGGEREVARYEREL